MRTLSERQVKAQGLTVEKEMPKDGVWTDPKTGMEYFVNFPGADKGFRNNPGKDWLEGLDLNKYPDVTKESYAEQRGNGIIQPVGTNDELAAQIMDKASQFPANGPVKQVQFTKEGYFMATNSRGALFISQRDFPSANGVFNPTKELMNAWNNIAKGKPLSFHEEYAMESLWHEIVHNRQKPTNAGGKNSLSRRMPRRTYPRFMESIGGKATQQARVLREGYGYGLYIRNFDKLLGAAGVKDDKEALLYFEEVCRREDRKHYQKAIVDYLVQHSDKPVKRTTFNVLLSKTSMSAARYDALLRFHKLSG